MRTNASGLQPPICAATCDGIRKIAPPITWLMPIAVRSQRPSARCSDGTGRPALAGLPGTVASTPGLYHESREMPLTIGSRLGPYEVVGQLGAGGMGEVYRGRDASLNRD